MLPDIAVHGAEEGTTMTDAGDDASKDVPQGAVIVGAIPDQPSRVLTEAARYARLFGAPLIVAHVDVTRFITYEDPDGYVHSAPIDLDTATGADQFVAVKDAAASALAGIDVEWSATQIVGDPALAIKHLAERAHARLIVVGTRRRGFGESIREFFTGSVAARLAHRQSRPVLVVPLEEPAADDEALWPEG